ncbi:hypothetical protein DY000_02040084 [Brassica cretica]|uniref:Uncharacterized protein n=1 Tax=Brassica cretica TaxID=69181 RepID=A0ABQ7BD03_BRACR|nr:hypothetical protein DY000_02040084 [Brassica cretica]
MDDDGNECDAQEIGEDENMDDDVQNGTQEQERVNANNWRANIASNMWTGAMHMGNNRISLKGVKPCLSARDLEMEVDAETCGYKSMDGTEWMQQSSDCEADLELNGLDPSSLHNQISASNLILHQIGSVFASSLQDLHNLNNLILKIIQGTASSSGLHFKVWHMCVGATWWRALRVSLTEILSKFSSLILPFPFEVQFICPDIADHFSYAGSGCYTSGPSFFRKLMKVAFGGVDSVSQPSRQPDRSNEQTGTSNALAFPGSKSTQKGVTECSCCWSNFTFKGLTEDVGRHEKNFEGGQEADKFDGGGGSKSSGSLDIRFRVEKVQAPLCDWKMATLEYSL